jgi:hypothetical protein
VVFVDDLAIWREADLICQAPADHQSPPPLMGSPRHLRSHDSNFSALSAGSGAVSVPSRARAYNLDNGSSNGNGNGSSNGNGNGNCIDIAIGNGGDSDSGNGNGNGNGNGSSGGSSSGNGNRNGSGNGKGSENGSGGGGADLVPASGTPLPTVAVDTWRPNLEYPQRVEMAWKATRWGEVPLPAIPNMADAVLKERKKILKATLRLYEETFAKLFGRPPQKEDKADVKSIYRAHKALRAETDARSKLFKR